MYPLMTIYTNLFTPSPSHNLEYRCPNEKLLHANEYINGMKSLKAYLEKRAIKLAQCSSSLENPRECIAIEQSCSKEEHEIFNLFMPNAAVWPLFIYDVQFTKYADGTLQQETAWGVSEDLLRNLVYAEHSLGADITTALDRALAPIFVGKHINEIDFENLCLYLAHCTSILNGVLNQHTSGVYRLDRTDPLSPDRIYELLGLLSAISVFISRVKSVRRFKSKSDVSAEATEIESALPDIQNIRNLIAITKNTILGYCNSYFSVVPIIDDITVAENAEKRAIELSKADEFFSRDHDFVKLLSGIERLHSKVLNRFLGFFNTSLIPVTSKASIGPATYLPLRSESNQIQKKNNDRRYHLRRDVVEIADKYREDYKTKQINERIKKYIARGETKNKDDGLEYNCIYDFTGKILHATQIDRNRSV